MIALDAAEPRLIEQWIDDGTLPNLKRLRDLGIYSRLASPADWLAGAVWPTFYTGTPPSRHGIYHFLQWRPEQMQLVRPSSDWLPARPFWRSLSDFGKRVVAVDLPMTYAPEPFEGVEVQGWVTHDRLTPPRCYPADLAGWIRSQVGSPPLGGEPYGPLPAKTLLKFRDELLAKTKYISDLAVAMVKREQADLFLFALTSTHTGGHKFWDLSGVRGQASEREREQLSRSLRDVYVGCDGAVGQILKAAPSPATVLVFSLHGMGPNSSRAEILSTMLARILGSKADGKDLGTLGRLRLMVPQNWRHSVKRRLPPSLQDRLTAFWRLRKVDWSTARTISLCMDLQGYVGINVKGREAEGIVEPGKECDDLCSMIVDGLRTFSDADSGEPLVRDIQRGNELSSGESTCAYLPDLMIRWTDTPAANHRLIASPVHGVIPWPHTGASPDGRSGNHRPEGFVLAAGSGIPREMETRDPHILDLAPTVCSLLEVPIPRSMTGRPLFRTNGNLAEVEKKDDLVRPPS